MSARRVELGLRENAAQFALLVAVNAFVGVMVGLERSTLPLIGSEDFDLVSKAAVLSFIVAFGTAKALTNLAAGALATRLGRRRLLIAGWALALPVPLLIAVAPSWGWIVAANVLLGLNQGLAWSMTVVMKIDLVGPQRRGLALGLNEAAGYGGVAFAAILTGWLAGDYAARDVLVTAGAITAAAALLVSVLFVRDTAEHVAVEQSQHDNAATATAPPLRDAFRDATWRIPALRACSQAGLVNNLNDALAWGLVPLYLAAHGASVGQIGLVAGIYPGVWGIGQIATGHWSDVVGRKPLIVTGMLLQAAALGLLAASGGAFALAAVSAVLLGAGTALVYPTLIAAISDAVAPVARAPVVGIYRFWRDAGYVAGGLIAGVIADAIGFSGAIAVVAGLTAASGLWVAGDLPGRRPPRRDVAPPRQEGVAREVGYRPRMLFGEEHTRKYKETDGEVGHDWQGTQTLLLTTKGRKSGEPRELPLIYAPWEDTYLVVASNGGKDQPPAWFVNLQADPSAEVQVKGDRFKARARIATPEEKAKMWTTMTAEWPAYDEYQKKTDREIPIVVLERAE